MRPHLRPLLLALLGLAAAGCGQADDDRSASALPPGLSRQVRTAGEAVRRNLDGNKGCAAAERAESLQERTIAAINMGAVPADLQEELLGSVNELVESIPCPSTDDSHAGHARELVERLLELSGGSA